MTTAIKKRFIDNNPQFVPVYDDNQTRFRVIVSGRQCGKTVFSSEELVKSAIKNKNSKNLAVAPTNKMAYDLFFDKIDNRLRDLKIPYRYYKAKRTFILNYADNKSTITLTGANDPDKLRGLTLDFVAIDEYDYMNPVVWKGILLPALAVKRGRAVFTSTPKGFGYVKELYQWGKSEDEKYSDYKSWLFKTINSPFIKKKDIDIARATLDPKMFKQEYEASFEENTFRVAYNFEKEKHVKDIPFNPNREICIGCDFNVNPMSWVAFQIIPKSDFNNIPDIDVNTLQDEVVVFHKEWKTEQNFNTYVQCNLLKIWLQELNYTKDLNFYGDATGEQKHSSQEINPTNNKFSNCWLQIEEEFDNAYFFYDKANPPVRNRINAMNGKFMNADNKIGIFINSNCIELIKDFENVSWTEEGKFDKSKERKRKIGHLFDAATYPLYYEFDYNKRRPSIQLL